MSSKSPARQKGSRTASAAQLLRIAGVEMVRTSKSAGGTISRPAESSVTMIDGVSKQQPLGWSLHGHAGVLAGDFGQQPSDGPRQFLAAAVPQSSVQPASDLIGGGAKQQQRAGPAAVTKAR